MARFKLTNVYVQFDDSYAQVLDPITKRPVYRANPAAVASPWERDVLGILDDLYLHSRVSRLLFDAFQQAGNNRRTANEERRLVVTPYTYADEKTPGLGVCNAYEMSTNPLSGAGWDRYDGAWLEKGTGWGASVIVHYDKRRWVSGGPCGSFPGKPGSAPDEVLLHEMLHGLRDMAGQKDLSKIGGDYDTMEEFYAILITNMYMSERGRSLLRKNHHGHQPLEKKLSSSAGFLTDMDHLRWVDWLFKHNAVFLRRVAEVNAPFNPLREYLDNVEGWKEILKSGMPVAQ
jgi:hypothetical protein